MKFNLTSAAYTFAIGIVISLAMAVIFNEVALSVAASICYLAAICVGLFFNTKEENNSVKKDK